MKFALSLLLLYTTDAFHVNRPSASSMNFLGITSSSRRDHSSVFSIFSSQPSETDTQAPVPKDQEEWETVIKSFEVYKAAHGDLKVRSSIYPQQHLPAAAFTAAPFTSVT